MHNVRPSSQLVKLSCQFQLTLKILNTKMKVPVFTYLIFLLFLGCKADYSKDISKEDSSELINDTTVSTSKNREALLALFTQKDEFYQLDWPFLLATRFEQLYNQELGMEVDVPIFNDTLSVLEGKNVTVSGYYIPVDETGDENIVILSAYPYAQCFFCGQAGVESIIDVLPTEPLPRLKTDAKVTFGGKLKLNKDNYDFLIYILEDAVLIKKE